MQFSLPAFILGCSVAFCSTIAYYATAQEADLPPIEEVKETLNEPTLETRLDSRIQSFMASTSLDVTKAKEFIADDDNTRKITDRLDRLYKLIYDIAYNNR